MFQIAYSHIVDLSRECITVIKYLLSRIIKGDPEKLIIFGPFVISQLNSIGSSKLLDPSPIFQPVLWGVDTRNFKDPMLFKYDTRKANKIC